MGKEILTFGDTEIEKNKFQCLKNSIFLEDVDIEKVLVSNKISSGEKIYKQFIDCLYNEHKIKTLHIMLSKTSTYVKRYNEKTKCIYIYIFFD